MKEVEAHKSKSHWTIMKTSEVKNKHKINMGSSRLFCPFLFQEQDITRWKINETQIHNLCTRGNETMGS